MLKWHAQKDIFFTAIDEKDDYQLRDRQAQYGEKIQNLHYWDIGHEASIA
jgi:hypothetical protein